MKDLSIENNKNKTGFEMNNSQNNSKGEINMSNQNDYTEVKSDEKQQSARDKDSVQNDNNEEMFVEQTQD